MHRTVAHQDVGAARVAGLHLIAVAQRAVGRVNHDRILVGAGAAVRTRNAPGPSYMSVGAAGADAGERRPGESASRKGRCRPCRIAKVGRTLAGKNRVAQTVGHIANARFAVSIRGSVGLERDRPATPQGAAADIVHIVRSTKDIEGLVVDVDHVDRVAKGGIAAPEIGGAAKDLDRRSGRDGVGRVIARQARLNDL